MAVLMTMEIPATREQYDAVDKAIDGKGNPPDGMIAHTAEDLGESMRIVDVWESAEAFGAFAQGRLAPAIAEHMGADGPEAPQPQFTELHNAYSA